MNEVLEHTIEALRRIDKITTAIEKDLEKELDPKDVKAFMLMANGVLMGILTLLNAEAKARTELEKRINQNN